jgi:hypothetical protein
VVGMLQVNLKDKASTEFEKKFEKRNQILRISRELRHTRENSDVFKMTFSSYWIFRANTSLTTKNVNCKKQKLI